MPPSPTQLVALRALLDRLIPADEFAGALAAETDTFVVRHLEQNTGRDTPELLQGLSLLDAEAAARHGNSATFSILPAEAQDALLTQLEAARPLASWPTSLSAARFLERFVELAHEGFYADPANGGNLAGTSWTMIGYDPRLPDPPSAPSGGAPSPLDQNSASHHLS